MSHHVDGWNTHHEVFPESWYRRPKGGMDRAITLAFRNRPCRKIHMRIEQHDAIDHAVPPPMPPYEVMVEDHHMHLRRGCQLCEELLAAGLREKTTRHPAYRPILTAPDESTETNEERKRQRKRTRVSGLRTPRFAPHMAGAR